MSLGIEMDDHDNEYASQWAAVERLPTTDRLRLSLFDEDGDRNSVHEHKAAKKLVDVTKLEAPERHQLIEKLLKHIENDNLRLLRKIRERIDK